MFGIGQCLNRQFLVPEPLNPADRNLENTSREITAHLSLMKKHPHEVDRSSKGGGDKAKSRSSLPLIFPCLLVVAKGGSFERTSRCRAWGFGFRPKARFGSVVSRVWGLEICRLEIVVESCSL